MNDRLSPLQLPDGSGSVVRVHAIDTTLKMYCKTAPFLTPVIDGFEHINFPTFAFLIHNTKLDRKVLFDLGGRKDYWNYSPATLGLIRASSAGMRVDKNIDDILLERGIALDSLEAVIWSHGHFDHIGDCSKFPTSVKIVVGQGFKKASLSGFPANPRSVILESDYGGRDMEEVVFHGSLKIGRFRAHDYFGDRSFYLLDVPGHAPGHMCGLVRTTPNSFCLLGADTCHIAGCFRPSTSVPLPEQLSERDGLDGYFRSPCPCSAFTALHPNADLTEDTKSTTKYFKASNAKGAAFSDPETANWSIDGLEEFDASTDVWILLAHDTGLLGILPMLNESDEDIGDWKTKGWKEDTRWRWLNELPRDGRPERERIVKGFWRNGVEVSTFDG